MCFPCILVLALISSGCSRESYDVVIRGGRVMDPETGLDAVREVGIRDGRIAMVSESPLDGSSIIDASGLVVAPGFIDLHQHQHDDEAYRIKALDGVTTALEMETGVPDYAAFLQARRGRAPINYGATASQEAARVVAWGHALEASNLGPAAAIDDPPSSPATNDPATPEQLDRLLAFLRAQLDAGALGIGIGLEYTPGATHLEIIRVFQLAAARRLPVFVHVRSAGRTEPGSSIESIGEVIAASAVSGAAVHIVHVNSSCLADTSDCLAMIEGARSRGLDVTTEAYPYGAGMTSIASALFNPGWRERRGLDYRDIELASNGERLTKERFDALRSSGRPEYVLLHMNSDATVNTVVAHPLTMIASDGLRGHPRGAGTYARVLARQVREQRRMTLMSALKKFSLMPARRLELATPDARRKGRVQVGADADLVLFDPATVTDNATYQEPRLPSTGMRFVLVNGVPIVGAGQTVAGAFPGGPLVAASR